MSHVNLEIKRQRIFIPGTGSDARWHREAALTGILHACEWGRQRGVFSRMSSITVMDRNHTWRRRGSSGVLDIKISGTVFWSSYEDINHYVTRRYDPHCPLLLPLSFLYLRLVLFFAEARGEGSGGRGGLRI